MNDNWKTYKLEEIASKLGDGLHGTPKYDDTGDYYFINGSNLVNGKIEINSNTKRVTQEEYNKYKKDLSDRTILLGINGTIGNVALYNNEKCVLGKSACYINVDNKFDKQFIKYVLLNDGFQNYIMTNATGTTIKNIGLKLIREYEALIPSDINEQCQIASILSSLDDKIELNLKMNQTLESIAQAIFKKWFVDFQFPGATGEMVNDLPEGWRIGNLDNVIDLVYGKGLKEENRVQGKYPVVGSNGIVGYHNQFLVEGPGIVIGRKGTIGEVIWIEENFSPIDTTFYIKDVMGLKELYFHYYLLLQQDFKKITSDSAVPGLNRNSALSTEVIIPPVDVIAKFNHMIRPLFNKIQHNIFTNNILIKIRDSLLPKLITGQIPVNQ